MRRALGAGVRFHVRLRWPRFAREARTEGRLVDDQHALNSVRLLGGTSAMQPLTASTGPAGTPEINTDDAAHAPPQTHSSEAGRTRPRPSVGRSREPDPGEAPVTRPPRRAASGLGPELRSGRLADAPVRSTLPAAMIERVGVALVLRPPDERTLTDQDRRYGTAFHQASVELATQVANGQLPALQDLWDRCRQWRLQQFDEALQKRLETNNSDPGMAARGLALRRAFATSREGDLVSEAYTPIVRQYASIVPKILRENTTGCKSSFDGLPTRRLSQTMSLDQREVELTRLFVHMDESGMGVALRRVPQGHGHECLGFIQHTSATKLAPLMAHANDLYQRVLSPTLSSPQERRDLLAEMHYVLAHAMPDERGSAAKSELAVRATALAVGMELPPFRPDVGPDLEAFVTPLPEFVQRYRGDYFLDRAAG